MEKRIIVVTPCSRPENLLKIRESIDLNYIKKWIIVYDAKKVKNETKLFNEIGIEEHHYDGEISWGHSQRNYAMDNLIHDDRDYIYQLDDDNMIAPGFYKIPKIIQDNKIYTFDQVRPNGTILYGKEVAYDRIDTAMFLVNFGLCKDIRWNTKAYNADYQFISECVKRYPQAHVYLEGIYCYYNKLNP
jgi:hypothetical protein